MSYAVTGDLTGTWTEVLWLTDSGLPVRVERTYQLSGLATFDERSELELQSLEPTT